MLQIGTALKLVYLFESLLKVGDHIHKCGITYSCIHRPSKQSMSKAINDGGHEYMYIFAHPHLLIFCGPWSHLSKLLVCAQNNSFKSRRDMKAIEKYFFTAVKPFARVRVVIL